MESFLTVILSAAISTVVTTIISVLIKKILTDEFKKQERNNEAIAEQHRQERRADVLESIREELSPITNRLENIGEKLEKIEDGTLSTLRNDILNCYYKCVDKGYRNDYDYQNIHHMFESYKDLNGNSYVADVVHRFDDLPTKEEYERNDF